MPTSCTSRQPCLVEYPWSQQLSDWRACCRCAALKVRHATAPGIQHSDALLVFGWCRESTLWFHCLTGFVAGVRRRCTMAAAYLAAALDLALASFNLFMLAGIRCKRDTDCRLMSAYTGVFACYLLLHGWVGLRVCRATTHAQDSHMPSYDVLEAESPAPLQHQHRRSQEVQAWLQPSSSSGDDSEAIRSR